MSFKSPSRSFSSSSLSGSMGSRGSWFGAISPAAIGNLANTLRPIVQINSSTFAPADDKEAMKGLNDRLAGYLSNVRLLEDSNNQLEEQIKEALMRKGAEIGRDWSAYEKIVADLRNQDVANLTNQISDSQVNVQMETKNSTDLNEVINNIRTQYERAVQKSREETEAWYQNKFDNMTAEVTQNTEALQAGKTELNELRRQKQSLEIDLQALHNMIRSLEDSLHETEARYAHEVNGYNSRILQLEGELGQVRAQVERQAAEYEALLNLKSKLEAEIATYHRLLEGVVDDKGDKNREEFSLEQALYAVPPVGLKKAIIITQEIVDGEVVSQRELEQNLTNHNDLEVSGEDQELTEQLELAVEEAKAEEEKVAEQLELAVEKAKAEEEKVAEQLELAVEKAKAEEEKVAEQLELAVEEVKAEEELTKQLPLA
ncbi:keratin, type I cytoskeletal 18-like [Sinocyclocheilus grahami]|uniref:keratin, type I cytoskeletal 18-like n=1 Tax=Sinocyclocheilus grahami TaxID=75366 RepID=UPI0007AD3823|nr:PREDICTED: keratin, type I cytoskeletal 18-like [Sinocyclocheilus grahami]